MPTTHERPIGRQFRAYEEQWRSGHDEAMRHADLEERLELDVAFFAFLLGWNEARRRRVSGGVGPYRREDDAMIRGLFERWRPSARAWSW